MINALLGWLKKMLGINHISRQTNKPYSRLGTDIVQGRLVTKRLGSETVRLKPAPTVRLNPEELSEGLSLPECSAPKLLLEYHGLTDVGCVRDHNEDAFFCAGIEDTGLFIVADGMGGHDAGEIASRVAVETVCREVRRGAARQIDKAEILKTSVQQANRAVMREGSLRGSNMGTTLGVALVADNKACVANIGDSRAYWIENGSIKQITEDHSLVAKLVSAGKLTKEEARNHSKSNLLYRTIGSDDNLKVDTFEIDVRKSGCLLLCSDGLWGEVEDEDIRRICAAERSAKAACSRLIQMANLSGGKDNITAVVVRVL